MPTASPRESPSPAQPAGRAGGSVGVLVCHPLAVPGQLTGAAWRCLDRAGRISFTEAAALHAYALRDLGLPLDDDPLERGVAAPSAPDVVLVASPPEWSSLGAAGGVGNVSVVVASVAPPGSAVLQLVATMDRLRSPGGCPWDAEQTHDSLAPYAVEEAYELAEAIASGDRDEIADELGDVLLQVAFHARVAQDHPSEPFDIDDVACRIVAKLQRRHPHVFADGSASTPGEVEASWEQIKAIEKPERSGPLDGIPVGLPPLERAAKVVSRLRRAGVNDDRLIAAAAAHPDGPGRALLVAALDIAVAGSDPSAALRESLRHLETHLT